MCVIYRVHILECWGLEWCSGRRRGSQSSPDSIVDKRISQRLLGLCMISNLKMRRASRLLTSRCQGVLGESSSELSTVTSLVNSAPSQVFNAGLRTLTGEYTNYAYPIARSSSEKRSV